MTDAQADAWVDWACDNHPPSARLPRAEHAVLMKLGRAARRVEEDPRSNWVTLTQALWMAGVDDMEVWLHAHGVDDPDWESLSERGLDEPPPCPEPHP